MNDYQQGNVLLARTSEHGFETYVEHLAMTGCLSSCFSADFGRAELGLFTGLAHDLGKASVEFQRRIQDPEHVAKVDHSSYGAYEAWNRCLIEAAFCIAGHHSGLPNYGNKVDPMESSTLWGRMKRVEAGSVPDAARWRQSIVLPQIDLKAIERRDAFSISTLIRFLFSALCDGDRLDAEYFVKGETLRRDNSLLSMVHTALLPGELALGNAPTLDAMHIASDNASSFLRQEHRAEMHRSRQGRVIQTRTLYTDGPHWQRENQCLDYFRTRACEDPRSESCHLCHSLHEHH